LDASSPRGARGLKGEGGSKEGRASDYGNFRMLIWRARSKGAGRRGTRDGREHTANVTERGGQRVRKKKRGKGDVAQSPRLADSNEEKRKEGKG